MKKLAYLLVVAVLACAAPAMAQGPFNDVPSDHWAYDAVNSLQQNGILIGYPDGTFAGKKTISRYEFATAIARIITMIPGASTGSPDLSGLAKKSDIPDVSGLAKRSDIPDVSRFATKADYDRILKLADEFRDELAAQGVDVDALKRDVAALDARVCVLEAEQARVKITGDANIFAIGSLHTNGTNTVYDLDNRQIQTTDKLLNNITLVKDFDLNIKGRVNSNTSAVATINYGSYLNYLSAVDDYVGGVRPTTKGANSTVKDSLSDNFFPYYLYIDTVCCGGSLTVGRFPLQFTPYTLKKIDVDSYTSILKTDDGNYPVDGIKSVCSLYGVDLTLFAAKNDLNDYLANGLTAQPTAGIGGNGLAVLHQLAAGHSVGGLTAATQTAGARATFGIPFAGNMGLTYYQTWSQADAATAYDQARVFGGDLSVLVAGKFNLAGSYTQSDTLTTGLGGAQDVDYQNAAWDAKVSTGFGRLGFAAGYKSIGRNFAAAGSWDKIGRWTNPVNIKGPYANLSYPIMSNLNLSVNGELLQWKDQAVVGGFGASTDDGIIKAEAGLNWGLSKTNSLALGYEYVKWVKDANAGDDATETYTTLGVAHQLGANAGVKIGYQLISYDDGAAAGPYGAGQNGRAGQGVVQFGVTF